MYADRDGQCFTMCWDNYATTAECTAIGVGSVVVSITNRSSSPLPYTLTERSPFFSGPTCDDTRDNDYDGATDTADSGCTSKTDPLEGTVSGCVDAVASDGCYALSQDAVLTGVDLVAPGVAIVPGHYVYGYLDVYRFPVAADASVTVPCVVLLTSAAHANPCATARGTFVSRTATLVERTTPYPWVTVKPLTSTSVCTGRLTLTVAGYGAENFPIVTPC